MIQNNDEFMLINQLSKYCKNIVLVNLYDNIYL